MNEKLLRWMANRGVQLGLSTLEDGCILITLDTLRKRGPILSAKTILSREKVEFYKGDLLLLDTIERMAEDQEKILLKEDGGIDA